ncbi:uncharacterized protein B0P05DRAFT_561217 [Gilbertella persicaria]|uniref:uncharacterized protein n=1 Tax=Gilbertella persicaria TaxID=101096 RepID=UPI00222066E4|nr:uncharacterized protein B0P05DRAFT_561217 [Gilbertella persicaria]KAI8054176.1 hypothetical protein B0P05DRAFT_561217 [Gilbertella persicaria]
MRFVTMYSTLHLGIIFQQGKKDTHYISIQMLITAETLYSFASHSERQSIQCYSKIPF